MTQAFDEPARVVELDEASHRLAQVIEVLVEPEENIECWFGRPIVAGDRAAVQWWGSWTEEGVNVTYAGVTVLRFDDQGKVIDHRDYADHVEQRVLPYDSW